jgi:two-component system, chemotaxis family, chemotaxis protein CheY
MLTILVVDDAELARRRAATALTSQGYNVVQAVDGLDGLARLRTGEPIAVVLLDVNMPRMNGLELLAVMNGEMASPPPTIVISSDGEQEVAARAKSLGAKAWIFKPVQPEMLVAAVTRIARARP